MAQGIFSFNVNLVTHLSTGTLGVRTVNGTALEGKDYIGFKQTLSLGSSEQMLEVSLTKQTFKPRKLKNTTTHLDLGDDFDFELELYDAGSG